jgi:hypothetical protein
LISFVDHPIRWRPSGEDGIAISTTHLSACLEDKKDGGTRLFTCVTAAKKQQTKGKNSGLG